MKYGIVVYKETANIGDDVQVYAAAQFLPQIDVVMDREHIDEVESDEPVAAVMNGWWLHRKWNWPPANCIRPLFVAFHYADYERAQYYGKYLKNEFLTGPGLEYLKAWGPIGCRDINSQELFDQLGVEQWFSGCMTLTLPQMPKVKVDKKYACFVDLNPKACEPLMEKARQEGVEPRQMTHAIEPYADEVPWTERSRKVEELLTIYQNASCVVTSRLHCALPCLALGTPVLLVRPDLDNIRFQPYVNWMHTATVQDAIDGKVDYSMANPPANSGAHLPTRNKLIETVRNFVANADKMEEKYHLEEIDRLRWQHQVLRDRLEKNLEEYRADVVNYDKIIKRDTGRMQRMETAMKEAKREARRETTLRERIAEKLAEVKKK